MNAADNRNRAVCILCRPDPPALRTGRWVCARHWRQLVRLAGVMLRNAPQWLDAELRETAARIRETD